MRLFLLLLALFLASCSAPAPLHDSQCHTGLVARNGACVTPTIPTPPR